MVDYKIFYKDKFTIIGSPTITDDGMASDINTQNYIKILINIDKSKPFEFISPVFTQSVVDSDQHYVLQFWNSAGERPLAISAIGQTLRTSYRLASQSGFTNVNANVMQADQKYQVKITYTGDSYLFQYKIEDGEWQTFTNGEVKTSEELFGTLSEIRLGYHNSNPYGFVNGSLDLTEIKIKSEGAEIFIGGRKGNTVDKLRYLKESKELIRQSIEAKGVEVPTNTPFRQYADKISEISGGGEPYKKSFSLYRQNATTNISEDGILTCDGTSNSYNNKVCSSFNSDIGYNGFIVECKFNVSPSAGSGPNIIIGADANDAFVIGTETAVTPYLGIWLQNKGSDIQQGITPIQTGKDYWLRFTFRVNSSTRTYMVELKENKNEEYHVEWSTSNSSPLKTQSFKNIVFGGGYYGGQIWGFNGTIDLKECIAIPSATDGVVINVGG